jgi:hypothetical protein
MAELERQMLTRLETKKARWGISPAGPETRCEWELAAAPRNSICEPRDTNKRGPTVAPFFVGSKKLLF